VPDKPLVYLIYGTPNSGRREVIFDLVEGGIEKGEHVLYFKPTGEEPSLHDEQIDALEHVSAVDWSLQDCKITHGKLSAAPDKIIFLAPGRANPVDAAEALKIWCEHNNCQLGRILTVVNCRFLQEQEKAIAWFDACIHFSDMVLLNRRTAGDNKWAKNFEERYKKNYYPCLFAMVRKGRLSNPVAVLEPEARRVSLYFDELIPIEDDEFEDEEQPEDIKPDRYIERNESGQRVHPVPDIAKWLD